MNLSLETFDPTVLLTVLVILLVLSAFFSGSETALLGFDWLRLRYLSRKGNRRARTLEKLLHRKDRLIGTILVGNNVVNVAASAIATTLAIAYFGEEGIVLATAAMTLALLIFGEITPKTYAARHTEGVGLAAAPVFALLSKLFYPLVLLVTGISSALLRLFGSRSDTARPAVSEDEIRLLLTDGAETSSVAEGKRVMLHGIFTMSRQTAREVMVPRNQVRTLDIATDVATAARQFVSTGYTRLPVYRESVEKIVGVVHARDALDLLVSQAKGGLASIVRETFFVPETMTLESLLGEFQTKRTHIAVVVDEYGGFEGIVTLEDVLEEIVGEIRDEHDVEADAIRFLPGGEALVHGSAGIRDVNKGLGLALPTSVDVTLAGFVTTALGHIPETGESFLHKGARFTVERTGEHRVLLVRVTPASEKQ